MDAEPIDAREMTDPDRELNEALEKHLLEEHDGLSIQNQRLAKIQEYEEAALSRSDPFAAVIGMGNSLLQRIFEHMGAAILEELDGCAPTVEKIRELSPEIRLLTKLRNSIETDLAVQPPNSDQQVAGFRYGSNSNGFNTKMAASERDRQPKRWRANG